MSLDDNIVRLYENGWPLRQIGYLLNVSRLVVLRRIDGMLASGRLQKREYKTFLSYGEALRAQRMEAEIKRAQAEKRKLNRRAA